MTDAVRTRLSLAVTAAKGNHWLSAQSWLLAANEAAQDLQDVDAIYATYDYLKKRIPTPVPTQPLEIDS